jgi:hypothetical protein
MSGNGGLRGAYLPPAGETSERWPKARNRSSESISANGGLSATPREGCEKNWPDQGQTSDFARGGLGEGSANGTEPLSWKI